MYVIYCIECVTPKHVYIGQTTQFPHRLNSHRDGNVKFTLKHGMTKWCVVGFAETLEGVYRLEVQEYHRLTANGYIVGGFSYKENLGYMYGCC